jgi:hypothetical protein
MKKNQKSSSRIWPARLHIAARGPQPQDRCGSLHSSRGPRPYRAGLAQRPAGTSRCWRCSHAASKATRGAALATRGCGNVMLSGGLCVVLGKGSVAQGVDTAETSPAHKLVTGDAPGELAAAAAMLWLGVLCEEKKK